MPWTKYTYDTEQFIRLLNDYDYNLPLWPVTMGRCINIGDGMEHHQWARGGGRCIKCIEREMKELFPTEVGKSEVTALLALKKRGHTLFCQMVDSLRVNDEHSG